MSDDTDTVAALGFTSEPWTARGACRGVGAAQFFTERGEATRPAKAVCATCPVTAECLDYALRNKEKFGVWGGTSERERRKMRREQGISAQPAARVDYDELARVASAAVEREGSATVAVMQAFGVTRGVADQRIQAARRQGYDIPYQQTRVA